MPDEKAEQNVDSTNSSEQTTSNGYSYNPDTNEITFPDGKTLSVDEVGKGYLRQQDYTRKTQELADLKRKLGSWSDFAEALNRHPRRQELEKKFLDFWKNVENEKSESTDEGEVTEQDLQLARMELTQERMDYEAKLGRRLTPEEIELVNSVIVAKDGDITVEQAHQYILRQVQALGKRSQEKSKAAAPGGGSNAFGTTPKQKPISQMTPEERRAAMRQAVEKMLASSGTEE